jgi:hypothetical protein
MQKNEVSATRVLARVLAEDMRNVNAGSNAKGPTTVATAQNPTTGRPDITNIAGEDGD